MTTVRWRWVAAALVCICGAAGADDAAVKKALLAKYVTFGNALKKRDLSSIEKMAAPGFTSQTMGGQTMDAKQSMEMLKQTVMVLPPVSSVTPSIRKLTLKGDRAQAEVGTQMTMRFTGQDKKPHVLVLKSGTSDTWVKSKGEWKILKTVDRSQSMTMDGKPFDPAMLGAGGAPGTSGR